MGVIQLPNPPSALLTHLGPPVELADDEALFGVDLQVEAADEAVQVEQVVGGRDVAAARARVARPTPPHRPPHAQQQREARVHLRRHGLKRGGAGEASMY